MTEYHVFRVGPDQPLLAEIKRYCEEKNINSALVLGIIGSLNEVTLAFIRSVPADYVTEDFTGPLEIAAAQGSIAMDKGERVLHIHLVISDHDRAVGGHLVEGKIFTTAEVALMEFEEGEAELKRKLDDYTGLKELQ